MHRPKPSSRSLAARLVTPVALTVAAAPLAWWGCTSYPLETPKPRPEQEVGLNYDVNPVRELDILVMVDNSNSMGEEQDNLEKNFPEFIKVLRNLPGGQPNLHIAVITSDVGAGPTVLPGNPACNRRMRVGGDRGEFQVKDGCGLDGTRARFLIDDGAGNKNYEAGKTLEQVFGCMAKIGTGGCGFEHQILATQLAIDGVQNPTNEGFLRKDAYLAIIYLTDEDDCSTDPTTTELFTASTNDFPMQTANLRCALKGHQCGGMPLPNGQKFTAALETCKAAPNGNSKQDLLAIKSFVDFFKSRKTDPNKVIVSGIIGWPSAGGGQYAIDTIEFAGQQLLELQPACSSANGNAAPGLRMKEFIESFGENGSVNSICDGDFKPALKRIAELIGARLNPGCIDAPLVDRDEMTPGTQPECQVADAKDGVESPIRRCKDGVSPPCWKLQAPAEQSNEAKCMMDRYRVVVDRGGAEPAPGTRLVVRCATCVANRGVNGCPCQGNSPPTCAAGYTCGGSNLCEPMK